ncbi:MAG: helix-turn-helix domain-containing protein [Actinomycetota bacterium]|nr:helix-turn-helix domain-containing protein [Actinomycetota bacterium]
MKAIRDYRTAIGMSQGDLAKKTGIDRAMISRIETGVNEPSFSTLRRIAEGMEASVVDLVAMEEEGISDPKALPRPRTEAQLEARARLLAQKKFESLREAVMKRMEEAIVFVDEVDASQGKISKDDLAKTTAQPETEEQSPSTA